MLIRTDAAGCTHDVLTYLTVQWLSYSVGFSFPANTEALLRLIPDTAWVPPYDGDGDIRDRAWVAELTDLLDLASWPPGMRVIVRKERPHPGAQLRITDARSMTSAGPRRCRRPVHRCIGAGQRPHPRASAARASIGILTRNTRNRAHNDHQRPDAKDPGRQLGSSLPEHEAQFSVDQPIEALTQVSEPRRLGQRRELGRGVSPAAFSADQCPPRRCQRAGRCRCACRVSSATAITGWYVSPSTSRTHGMA